MNEGTAAPGWYPDTENPGGQRWWDGARWTEDRRASALLERQTEAGLEQTHPTAPVSLESERVIVAAPLSYHGSAARIWPLSWRAEEGWPKIGWTTLAVVLVGLAWLLVTGWYMIFGLLVIPYRLIRRGQRKRKLEEARHRELLSAVDHDQRRP